MNLTDLTLFIIENAPEKNRDIIDYLNATLVPFIALLSFYIAYRQYKTDRQRFEHELYDRRIEIYKSIRVFLKRVMKSGSVSESDIYHLISSTTEASFFLSKRVPLKIEEIYSKSWDLIKAQIDFKENIGSGKSEKSKEIADRKSNLLKWFISQFDETEKLFATELGIRKR